MILTAGFVLLFVALVVLLWNVLTQVEEKATVRASLRQLEGYEVANVRDQELLKPVTERAVQPLLESLLTLGKRFTPIGYIEKTRTQFSTLGYTGTQAWDRFMAVRVVLRVLVVPWLFFVFVLLRPPGLLAIALAGLGAALLAKAPDVVLGRRVEARQK